MSDINEFKRDYDNRFSIYKEILEEIKFILDDSLGSAGIKIHGIYSRVKDYESMLKKCVDNNYTSPFEDIVDIAGSRIVCLLRSDLEKIEKVIYNSFSVISRDDKISDGDGIGYMSIHYVCKMKDEYNGPRYNRIRGVKFELQSRTLCMDAWAAASHYLDYKGEWDVPDEMKRAMNALSGLFYVADNEFENVYKAKINSSDTAKVEVSSNEAKDVQINLDTVQAYLKQKYPERNRASSQSLSELTHEIKSAGYTSIDEIDSDLELSNKFALKYEEKVSEERGSPGIFFNEVGFARISLSIASQKFDALRGVARKDAKFFRELQEEFKTLKKPMRNN